MSKTRLIVIIAVILLIIGLLVAGYFIFIKKQAGVPVGALPTGEGAQTPTGIIQQPAKKLLKISDVAAISPFAKISSIIYYSPEGVFQSNFDGSGLKKISPIAIPNLIDIIWSKDGNKALLENYDSNNIVNKYIYDYSTLKAYPLPSNIRSADFSLDGSKILFNYADADKGLFYIGTSNTDLTNIKKTNYLKIPSATISWLSQNTALIKTPPSGLATNFALLLDMKTGSLTNLISDVYGLNIKASPDGNNFIYSSTDASGKINSLSTENKNGQNRKDLGLQTLVDKCVFSQDSRTIFCAVPKTIPDDAILPDDYYQSKLLFDDNIWQINIETGEKKLVSQNFDILVDAENLILSPQENYLFFVNGRDGRLYSYKLQ